MAARLRLALAVSAGCAAALAAIVATSPRADSTGAAAPARHHGLYGVRQPAGAPGSAFALRDQSGALVRLRADRGRVVALAFVYSTCASCQSVTSALEAALGELPRPIPAFALSTDRRRDDAANVQAFLVRQQLAGRLRYLAGPRGALPAVWRAFAIAPRHAALVLVDRRGRARVRYATAEQLDPDTIAADIRTLEREPR